MLLSLSRSSWLRFLWNRKNNKAFLSLERLMIYEKDNNVLNKKRKRVVITKEKQQVKDEWTLCSWKEKRRCRLDWRKKHSGCVSSCPSSTTTMRVWFVCIWSSDDCVSLTERYHHAFSSIDKTRIGDASLFNNVEHQSYILSCCFSSGNKIDTFSSQHYSLSTKTWITV